MSTSKPAPSSTIQESRNHDPTAKAVANDASRATDAEHTLTIRQGFARYPKAVAWSILLSTCLVMEGYDVTLLGNLYSQPAFQARFGISDGKGGYQISAPWQSGLSNTFNVGSIFGLLVAGTCAERYGYRRTLMTALSCITGFIFIVFFAKNLTMLLFGEILCSMCWGIFQTITVTYATEVCPMALRAYLTTYVNLCWVFGQLIGAGVLKGVVDRMDQWAYRIPFAIQWIWPVPLIIGIYFAPDSPWWEVRKGRHADARRSLHRLYSSEKDEDSTAKIEDTLSLIIYTTELERSQQKGTTYLDCFRGFDLRRTEIVCCVYSVQVFCGSAMMGWAVYFMEQAGFSPSDAFAMNVGQSAVGAVGTMLSWFLMMHAGRRTLYLYGSALLALVLFIVGCLGIITKQNKDAQWTIGALIIVYTFIYDITIGPICYSLVPELSSTRLRNKSVVLARSTYNIVGIIVNILQPRMLNPTAWGWGAKSSFLWTGTCLMCVVWIYFRLPEPKGRTDAELDILFKNGVSARKFRKTPVDPFLYAEEIEEKLGRREKAESVDVEHVEKL